MGKEYFDFKRKINQIIRDLVNEGTKEEMIYHLMAMNHGVGKAMTKKIIEEYKDYLILLKETKRK